jgi:hypothetical protein
LGGTVQWDAEVVEDFTTVPRFPAAFSKRISPPLSTSAFGRERHEINSLAMAAVAGVTALDVLAARELSDGAETQSTKSGIHVSLFIAPAAWCDKLFVDSILDGPRQ